jgi:hypothetical protein
MASFIGPGKKEVLRALQRHKKGPMEITPGLFTPQFLVRCSNKTCELLPLLLNKEDAEKISEQRNTGDYFIPEMTWRFFSPEALIFTEKNLQTVSKWNHCQDGWTYKSFIKMPGGTWVEPEV